MTYLLTLRIAGMDKVVYKNKFLYRKTLREQDLKDEIQNEKDKFGVLDVAITFIKELSE